MQLSSLSASLLACIAGHAAAENPLRMRTNPTDFAVEGAGEEDQQCATQKLAQFEKLPIYSETAEVAKVLYDMLADLDSRLSVLETVDSNAQVELLNVNTVTRT